MNLHPLHLIHSITFYAVVGLTLSFVLFVIVLRIRSRKPYASKAADGKQRTQIVVLGAGFGGVYTAQRLEQLLGRRDDYEITLVNRENYLVFQPMLAEVISSAVGITDTVSPLRGLLPRTNLHVREVENVDLDRRTITVSAGFLPRPQQVQYDHLVLALGTVTDFRGMRGLPEHAMPFKNLSDALNLRNHLIHVLEEASIEQDQRLRRQLLTFVVAGGGFSGVEVAAEMNDFVREAAEHYRAIDPHEIRVCLLHSRERILPEVTEKLALFAQDILRKRGVEIMLHTRLLAATSEAALLADGGRIETKTLVSTIPSSPHPLIEKLSGLPKTKAGRVVVDATMQVKGSDHLWAVGDCAEVPSPEGGPCPPTAQHAIRQGHTLAENLVASIRGGQKRQFDFKGLGKMGSLGHRSAVADIFGFQISGILAWFMWRSIYLMKMPGWGRRLKVASSWALDIVLPPDFVQLKLGSSPGITREHFEPGQEVFHEGDIGDRVYIILAGEAEVLVERDGQEKVLARLKPGEYFGEMAVLDQTVRVATVRCATPMDALNLPKREFALLVSNLPDLKASFEGVKIGRALNRVAQNVDG